MEIKLIARDNEGNPSLVEINKNGRIAKIVYDSINGFKIAGSEKLAKDWLPVLFPFEPQSVFNIPNPLPVTSTGGGALILYDGMENLLKWTNPSGLVAHLNTFAFLGDQCLKVTCQAADTVGRATRDFGFPQSGKMTFETMWSINDFTKLNWLGFYISRDNGLSTRDVAVRYLRSTKTWQYLNSAAAWTNIEDSTQNVDYYKSTNAGGAWHRFKFGGDFINDKYLNLEINEQTFKLDEFALRSTISGGTNRSYLSFHVDNVAGQEVAGYLDEVRVLEVD